MSDQSALTITGGPHGVVASSEDITTIKDTLEKVRDNLNLAAADTTIACSTSYGQLDRPIRAITTDTRADEVKLKLESSRTAVLEGMESANNSENAAMVVSVTADSLIKSLAETLEIYETAEREAMPSNTFGEGFILALGRLIGFELGLQASPFLYLAGGPIFGKAAVKLGLKWSGPLGEAWGLYKMAEAYQRSGDKWAADVIRENYLEIRRILNDILSVKLAGVPSATELAGRLTVIDKAFNKRAPWEDLNGIKVTAEAVPQITGLRRMSDLMALVDDAHAGGKRIDGSPPDETRHGFYLCKTRGADGQISWTIVLPGTSTWSLQAGENHQDTMANLEAFSQIDTSLSRAVQETLDEAGVKPGDQVLLAGHSQGGIIAAQLSKKLSQNQRLADMQVLTVGSPIAEYQLPETVRVLAVEHREDIVPALSGPKNPDGSNWITVSREASKGPAAIDARNDIMAAHGSGVYAKTLDLIESEGSPETDAWRGEIASIFAANSTTTATYYNVTRVHESNPVTTQDKTPAKPKSLRLPVCPATSTPVPGRNNISPSELYSTKQ